MDALNNLFKKLEGETGLDKFKQCIQEWEYDYQLIKEDVNDEQSELNSILPPILFNKIKKIVNADELGHPDSDNLQILMNIVSKSQRKNAVAILQRKLTDDQYEFENIVDDIRDESNSDILDELRDNNVDHQFMDMFCNAVYVIHDKLNKDIENEWNLVYNELKKIRLFKDNVYKEIINYFRNHQWTVHLYLQNEFCYNENEDTQSQSQFYQICPNLSNHKRKALIKLFNKAVTKSISSIKPPITYAWNKEINNSFEYDYEQGDAYCDISNENKLDEYDMLSNYLYVDDDNHSDFIHMKQIIENIHKITNTSDCNEILDTDLKKLCTIFNPNNILLMNDIRSRQVLIAFCNADFSILCNHLSIYEEKRYKRDLFYKYVCNPRTLPRKLCNEKKLDEYCNAFTKLQATRWLCDGKIAQMMANNRSYDFQYIDDMTDAKWNIDDDIDDDLLYDPNMDPNVLCCDDHRIIGSARQAQIILYAFILGLSRKILETFENNLNCDICLDLRFGATFYDNKYVIKNRHNYPIEMLDKIILQFERVFDDPKMSKTFIENMKNRKLCQFIMNMNSNDNGSKMTQFETVYKGLNKKEIGFELPKNWKEYDEIHLFHLMRMKKQFIGMNNDYYNDKGYPKYKRLGLCLFKFKGGIKYYIIYEGSMIRILPKDIVQWIQYLFLYKHDCLKWNEMKYILKNRLNDYNKLSYNKQWRNIKQWAQIDYPYWKKCNQFIPKCRQMVTNIDRKYDYAFKIQNDYLL